MGHITGGCLCGAVTYSTDADPVPNRSLLCHCTRCQRHTGSAFAAIMAFPAGTVVVSGVLKTYTEPGGTSGEPLHRRFCPTCGTPVILEREGGPSTLVTAGTLDEPSMFSPKINIFCDVARPWVRIASDTQDFPGYIT